MSDKTMREAFKREERYTVIKHKDLKYESAVHSLHHELKRREIPTRECVVVESHWPIYEQTWDAVQRLAEGRPQAIDEMRQSQQAQGESGQNRCGVDMSYFHSLFERELSELESYKPDELARVLARAAKTACAEVLTEPEFQQAQGKPDLTAWVVFDNSGGPKFIKKYEDGSLAIFDTEDEAETAACRSTSYSYKKVDYYRHPPAPPANQEPWKDGWTDWWTGSDGWTHVKTDVLHSYIDGPSKPAPAAVSEDCTVVPNSALRWLFGEEGEFEPTQSMLEKHERTYGTLGKFWWRSVFRDMIGTPIPEEPAAVSDDCSHCGGTGDVSGEYPGVACPHCLGASKPNPPAPASVPEELEAATTARDNAVQEAQCWAQEARTQKSIVLEIGQLVGCDRDWEMIGAVREALAREAVPEIPLDEDTEVILGRPNFSCIDIASRLRELGHDIKRKSECEQAAVLVFLLNHYLKYGKEWRSRSEQSLAPTPSEPDSEE